LSVPSEMQLHNTVLHDVSSDDKWIGFAFEDAVIRKVLKCSAVCRCVMQVFR